MNKKYKLAIVCVAVIAIFVLAFNYFHHHTVAVLEPRGPIALKERNLLLVAVGLMLIVVIPVFVITFLIVWKYREGHKGKYRPDFDHSRVLETIWWLIPSALILVLSVIIWNSTHSLDPYRKIASSKPPLTIEVVALDWKWLFIYPKQHVASVNMVHLPVNTPVTFYITADAPMNSFWIPQLSGQIYAMPGMTTQLNLMASSTGDISGSGFAGMHFVARSTNQTAFNSWVNTASSSKDQLNQYAYNQLDKPSINNPVSNYSNASTNIFASTVNKYLIAPGDQVSSMVGMQ
jgi:cytochrome o ubiquinol oxidase subunit 2